MDHVDTALFDEPLVLVGEDGAPFFTPGKDVAYYIDGPSWVNNHIHALRPVDCDGRFLAYALNSVDYANYITGSTRDKLTQDDLKKIQIPYPEPYHQRRVADFLDAETARLDLLAEIRGHRQLAAMHERFSAFVKLRTGRSGYRVEFLPDGWSVYPIRRVINWIKTGATPPSNGPDFWLEKCEGESISWYGPSSVQDLLKLGLPVKRLASSVLDNGIVPVFPAGSVLVVGIGATAGKVAYLDHSASGNQQMTALVPGPRILGQFLAWQLWAATEELRDLAPYTTLPIINNDFLKSFPITLPPLQGQEVIVSQIDKEASKLDSLGSVARRAQNLIAERRQALITAAVTGEFDVSSASGRGVTDGVVL